MSAVVIVPGAGLGDIALTMPGIKILKEQGHRTICVINKTHIKAFDQLGFVDYFIPIPTPYVSNLADMSAEEKLLLQQEIIDILNNHDILFDDSTEICASMQGLWHWSVIKDIKDNWRYKFRKTLPELTNKVYPYTMTILCNLGISPAPCVPIFGFKKSKHSVRVNKFNVGICIGSHDKLRRVSPQFIDNLIDTLPREFDIYLFGKYETDEILQIQKVKWISNNLSIDIVLTYLEQMNVVVTPDTGIFHAACHFGIPTVIMPTREIAERVVCGSNSEVHIVSVDDNLLTCAKECNCKIDERLVTDQTKPFFKRLLPIDAELHKKRMSLRCDYSLVECRFEYKYGVQCLNKINVDKIKDIILDIHRRYTVNIVPESTFTAASEYCSNPQMYSAFDCMTAEKEVCEFVASLSNLVKSNFVVEAGSYKGIMAEYIAKLGFNIHTVENNESLVHAARKRLSHYKNATVIHKDIFQYTPPCKIDILIIDIDLGDHRLRAFNHLKDFLHDGSFVVIHDTSDKSKQKEIFLDMLKNNWIEIKSPRGLIVFQYHE